MRIRTGLRSFRGLLVSREAARRCNVSRAADEAQGKVAISPDGDAMGDADVDDPGRIGRFRIWARSYLTLPHQWHTCAARIMILQYDTLPFSSLDMPTTSLPNIRSVFVARLWWQRVTPALSMPHLAPTWISDRPL
nr:hypothetical protein CFP56_29908 [Quercus suber]